MVLAWVLAQVLELVFDSFGTPEWVMKTVLALLATGLPLTLFFSWAFDMTPEGLKRTDTTTTDTTTTGQTDSKEPKTVGETQAAARNEALSEASQEQNRSSKPVKASVAVLPFVNMSGDPENEYFSDGLSEELLNVLAKMELLKVAARTSSFHFKGQTGDIADIASRLGVASVLEGSVRQSGNKVRITAQLINAADGYHLWSETFDRDITDIFAVQDEIASAVALALKVKLLGESQDRRVVGGTTNPQAFQAYLRGVHAHNRGSEEIALTDSLKAFEQAIEIDPKYAQAYAGLAFALDQLATNGFIKYEAGICLIENAAFKSIKLAPDLADGYLVLGRMRLHYKLDQQGARSMLNTALELNPGNSEVQLEYARISSYLLDVDASVTAARKALELDPVSMFAHHFLGHVLYFGHRYREAINVFREAIELNPHYPRNHYTMGMCMFFLGDAEAAYAMISKEPLAWMKYSGSAILLHHLGRSSEAKVFLKSLQDLNLGDDALYQQGQVYSQWGDFEMAVKCLNGARDDHDPGLSQLLVDPLLDPIRDDSGFKELATKVGFTHTP